MQKEINWLLKEKYLGKASPKFDQDVKRLQKGEPLDYVIGFSNFLACKIDLSKKPLIPRTETEYWVKEAIDEILRGFGQDASEAGSAGLPVSVSQNRDLHILDIFAGSGCIGISIMRHINNSHVVLAEKDKKFVQQIKINAKLNNIAKNRYKVIQSDIFSKVTGKFDYIFANPPYIPTSQKSNLQPSVLNYEPKAALFGGADGLFYIRKFLAEAKNFLKPNGKIFMEFDSVQKKELAILIKKEGYGSVQFYQDQYEKPRWVAIAM